MAKQTKRNRYEHLWKPGQSGNPNGRPPLTEREKELRHLSKKDVLDIITVIKNTPIDALKEVASRGDMDSLFVLTANVWLKAIEDGDFKAWESLMNRAIGKPTEHIEAKVQAIHDDRPTEQIIKEGQEAIEYLKTIENKNAGQS